jgi:simple sugar transport system permease protein
MLMGALWALLVALLKRYMRVSEIFAGLLDLILWHSGFALYSCSARWKRPRGCLDVGYRTIADALWLPTVTGILAHTRHTVVGNRDACCRMALDSPHSLWQVRACGRAPWQACAMGVPATRRTLEAMALCGACAGLAGALQIIGVYHSLVPNVASGIGLMGLLRRTLGAS